MVLQNTSNNREAKKVSTELLDLFSSYDSYREQWEDQAIENYKLLKGHKPELEEDDARSNLHIPRTYQIVDTIRSRFVNAFFNRRPYIEFTPSPSKQNRDNLQKAEDKAKVAAALVDEQLDKNKIIAKYYDYITQMLTFPAAIMAVGWRYEEKTIKKKVPVKEIVKDSNGNPFYSGNYVYEPRKSNEVIWDDNEIKNIDFFDFWPDPKAQNIDGCRGVFQREFITYQELMDRLNYLDYLNEGRIYPVDFEKIMKEVPEDVGREKRMSEVGFSTSMAKKFYNSDDKELKKNTKFEILHYWENDRHAMIINRNRCIYDGPSPYWRHRKIPFVVESYDRLPNEFYGMSAIDIIADLQQEENTIHNQRNDNINMIINKMWKVRRGADIDESELVSRPHGIVHVDRTEDVQPFEQGDVPASSFEQQQIVAQSAENAVGATPIMQGTESRGDQTATESRIQGNNASMRFNVKTKIFNYTGIKRLAHLMDMNNQQFIDGQRLIRTYPEESGEWRYANPGMLIGEFDYRPAGANIDQETNKEVRREQLSQMMSFLMEAGIPFVNYHELVKEWLSSFDIVNSKKFILSKEEWEQRQQQQQQQQMMAQQQQNNQQSQSDNANLAQQQKAVQEGKSRGRRPQQPRNPQERVGGNIR